VPVPIPGAKELLAGRCVWVWIDVGGDGVGGVDARCV